MKQKTKMGKRIDRASLDILLSDVESAKTSVKSTEGKENTEKTLLLDVMSDHNKRMYRSIVTNKILQIITKRTSL